ncbi:MAG: hypothetical protein M1820_006850 [Bogoriella megaspora]|nr:MAG: hypothetical protein M1820_006850 [Bogoriella megaspora]
MDIKNTIDIKEATQHDSLAEEDELSKLTELTSTPTQSSDEPTGIFRDVTRAPSAMGVIEQRTNDLNLPRTMCQRLAKGVLPANTQIQKDALLAMTKSATVFINYVATHAQDNAVAADKSSIRPKDVIEAIRELEFEDFIPRLEIELESQFPIFIPVANPKSLLTLLPEYNTEQCNKRNNYRRQKREEKAAADIQAATQAAIAASEQARENSSAILDPNSTVASGGKASDGTDAPPSKKLRISGATGEDSVVQATSAMEDEGLDDEEVDEPEDPGDEGADEDGDEPDDSDLSSDSPGEDWFVDRDGLLMGAGEGTTPSWSDSDLSD